MSNAGFPVARFKCGKIVTTSNALERLTQAEILGGISRHQVGDWGDVSDEDLASNEVALNQGARLFSVYHAANGTKFWIITEADRSVTTVLLPQDY